MIFLECDFVNDPILGYLLERYRDLSGAGIEKAEFDIPFRKFHMDVPIHDDIIRNEAGIAAVDTDTKYRNLARALADEYVTERAYQRLYGDVDKK